MMVVPSGSSVHVFSPLHLFSALPKPLRRCLFRQAASWEATSEHHHFQFDARVWQQLEAMMLRYWWGSFPLIHITVRSPKYAR